MEGGRRSKRFFIFRYIRDGDTLTIDYGNSDAFAKLMRVADIHDDGAKHVPFFLTPADWFSEGAEARTVRIRFSTELILSC